jgi:c-di-GMP-binding flagellar brake protein YcgR
MLSRQLQVHEPQRFQILDISIGGMSFYSVTPFDVGKVLTVSLEGLLTIEARVLACTMEETDAMFLEVRYKVHCHFEDERYGMRLMVLAMQSEDSSVGIMP